MHKLVNERCVLLADDMGLGKTVQAAVAMARLFTAGTIRRALVVCPASLCHIWRYELRRWAEGIPVVLYQGADRHGMLQGGVPILVGSYETVTSDLRRPTADGQNFTDVGIDLLLLDEAQRIKNSSSIGSRVISSILAPHRWALTGTPLENHPRELASVLRFLQPNEFRNKESLDDITQAMVYRDRCMLRRRKADVGLELPSKTRAYVPTDLTPVQHAEYDHELERIRDRVRNATTPEVIRMRLLGGLQRLRRIATISNEGESGKLDFICEDIESAIERGQKVVIFSSFAKLALPRIADRLSVHGTTLFTGDMRPEEREAATYRFLSDNNCRIMCASLRAAGVGVTWTVASIVYQTDLWWNPQVLRQAEDRVHRIGQENSVLIKRLMAVDTIEEQMSQLLSTKEAIFDFMVEGAAASTPDATSLESLLSLIGLKSSDLRGGGR